MEKQQLLYEGKAKKVYATDDPELLIVSYKDDATAFNGVKRGTIAGKDQDPGERNSNSTGDLPVSVQESPAKVWVGGGLLQGWGHGL